MKQAKIKHISNSDMGVDQKVDIWIAQALVVAALIAAAIFCSRFLSQI